jgi:hypothetical protein
VTRSGWRLTLGAVLALLAAGIFAGVLFGSPGSSAAGPSPRVRAQQEAERLITAVRLPGAAVAPPSGTESASVLAVLNRAAGPTTVERSMGWRVAEAAGRLRTFLATHPPSGTRPAGSLRFVAVRHLTGLTDESLVLTVLPVGRGASIVRAEAQVAWLVPRSPSERVPAAARRLEIIRAAAGGPPSLVIHVRSRRLVSQIARLLDDLPPVQPGPVYHCPAQFRQIPVVSFIFSSAGQAHPRVLARASEQADVRTRSSACAAVRFSVAGRSLTPLLGGHGFLRAVGALLGRRLWTAPYAA